MFSSQKLKYIYS